MQLARYDTVLVRVSSEENKSRRSWIVRRLSSQAAEKKKAFSFVIRAAYSHWRTHKSSIAPLKAANARPPPAIALTPLFRARIAPAKPPAISGLYMSFLARYCKCSRISWLC